MRRIEQLRSYFRYKNPSSKDVGLWPLTSHPTKRELLRLPERPWRDAPSRYDSLYLVPTDLRHGSGYTLIAIVGLRNIDRVPEFPQWVVCAEIAAYCGDICWNFPKKHPYDNIEPSMHRMMLRTALHLAYPDHARMGKRRALFRRIVRGWAIAVVDRRHAGRRRPRRSAR